MKAVKKKHKAEKFIVYFQNFTNTYLPLAQLKLHLEQVQQEDVVAIALSSRPDCLSDRYLEYLRDFKITKGIN